MHRAGGAPNTSAPNTPVASEVLHESPRTRVTWLRFRDGTVVRKQPLGPDADERLRHEKVLLARLAGIPGIAQLSAAHPAEGSLGLEDAGRTCLAERPLPLAVGELTTVSLSLARAVAAMHRRGVVHRDISPANVVLRDGRTTLIDFALATTSAELRPDFTPHNEIVGTMPYLAPEQTGRTGRSVDQRADLYALGATLYEVATGQPPFGAGDPMRLIHDQMARVPVPPRRLNPDLPRPLSDVIMHLLEKEPDNRYQSADGLIHDLARIADQEGVGLRVGEHDFPLVLRPPSHLVGRDAQIARLGAAFAQAMSGRSHGVLISGGPGVGKTSLLNELRPIVTTRNGWFISGAFDRYRRDQDSDAVRQALRGLGRLLLAEPEEELQDLRRRLRHALGRNAGLVSAVQPEFAMLLDVPPDPGDPLTARIRARRAGIEMVRAVASPQRPVVFVVDDLQWAARTPLDFVDAVFSGEAELDGVLLVATYREDDVDASHPLAEMLARWQSQEAGPAHLRLENLPASSLAEMLADMLRLPIESTMELAKAVAPRTSGNPYDTIELLNALRHSGTLWPGDHGWQWDAQALHRLGRAKVTDLLASRFATMPAPTRELMECLACLGATVDAGQLRVATGLDASVVESRLEPAMEDGLVVMEPETPELVRFRHDRVRDVVLEQVSRERLSALRLGMARRLASRPELDVMAADQYLSVVALVRQPGERRAVIDLLRRAAEQAKLLSNHLLVERYLASALTLADPADIGTRIELQTGRHAAFFSAARLDDADEVYRDLDRLSADPARHADATLVQVSSLTNRNRPLEAVNLGVDLLRRLGCAVPPPEALDAEIDRGITDLYRWVERTTGADDLRQPEVTDRTQLAVGALMTRLMAPAYFSDPRSFAWLTLEAARRWAEHGPCRTLVAPVSHLAFLTVALRQDYRTGHRVVRRIVAVAQARGYEPDTAEARFLYAVSTGHWFEPLEENVALAHRAREGLLQGGDLQKSAHTYFATLPQLFDSAPTLDDFAAEVEAGIAFAARTANDESAIAFRAYQRLAGALGGRTGDRSAEEPDHLEGLAANTNTAGHVAAARALSAVLLNDRAELGRSSAELMALLPAIPALYLTATAHLVRALVLADRVHDSAGDQRSGGLAELDSVIDWIAGRAADAPANFLHLLRLVEAERAWAAGDFRTAAQAFDSARREASARRRPWHRALISERTGRFYLAHGMEHAGYELLAEARREYRDWGSSAKVSQLDWAYPTLKRSGGRASAPDVQPIGGLVGRRSSITAGAIDLLGILTASNALSSETSVEGLRARLVDVLSTMTGATAVHLLLRGDGQTWLLSTPSAGDGGTIPLAEAGRRRLIPVSAVRYAARTSEPLVVDDATRDDRFARDPYFAELESCSLLVVPIFLRGGLRALLLLENRLIRGAFAAERLDGVMLIAGQLAVSLDNALLYASLEQKVAARTEELAQANERLEQLSVTDSLTGMANRRRFDRVFDAQWKRAQRLREPIALAIVDIDHFKLYNDHNGHAAGDKCLQRVATELRHTIRGIDLAARYGGEEFAIVMPGTDLDAGIAAAERLRLAVMALGEPHDQVEHGIVTVSIGVAAMVPPHPGAAETLVELADAQLYRAKRAGRNRVRPVPPKPGR